MNKKLVVLAIGSIFSTGAAYAAGFGYSGTTDFLGHYSGTTGTTTTDTISVGGLTSTGAVTGTMIKMELPV